MTRAQPAVNANWCENFRITNLELSGIDKFTCVFNRAAECDRKTMILILMAECWSINGAIDSAVFGAITGLNELWQDSPRHSKTDVNVPTRASTSILGKMNGCCIESLGDVAGIVYAKKEFMLPAGLSMLGVSEKALDVSKTARMPRCYFSFEDMLKFNDDGYFPIHRRHNSFMVSGNLWR